MNRELTISKPDLVRKDEKQSKDVWSVYRSVHSVV